MKPKNSHENHLTQPTPTSPSQVQQMISCSNQADGCGGGNPVDGYSHWSNWRKLGKTGWIFDQSLFLPARETSGCYGPCGFSWVYHFLYCILIVKNNYILVGGLEHEFHDFPFSWEFHHPN